MPAAPVTASVTAWFLFARYHATVVRFDSCVFEANFAQGNVLRSGLELTGQLTPKEVWVRVVG